MATTPLFELLLGLLGNFSNVGLVLLGQPALRKGARSRPGASAHRLCRHACLSRDDVGHTALAVVVLSLALAVAHAGAGALADGLCWVRFV